MRREYDTLIRHLADSTELDFYHVERMLKSLIEDTVEDMVRDTIKEEREKETPQEYSLVPLPLNGELMTLEDWVAHVNSGLFTDNDGYGRVATTEHMSNIILKPSLVIEHDANTVRYLWRLSPRFTHVIWFNK